MIPRNAIMKISLFILAVGFVTLRAPRPLLAGDPEPSDALRGVAFPRVSVLPASKAPSRGYVLPSRLDVKPKIDGDLSDWPREMPSVSLPGNCTKEDLSAFFRAGWDDSFFYMAVAVTDDKHNAPLGMPMWQRDCLHTAVDPKYDRTLGALGADDSELAFALLNDGTTAIESVQSPYAPNTKGHGIRFAARLVGNETAYELAIPWTTLGVKAQGGSVLFGFNVVITDNDGLGRKNWIELTPGLVPADGMERNAAQYATAVGTSNSFLLLASGGIARPDQPTPVTAAAFTEKRLASGASIRISLDATTAKQAAEIVATLPEFEDGIAVVEADLAAGKLRPGKTRLSGLLVGSDGAKRASAACEIVTGPTAAEVGERLRLLRPKLTRVVKLAVDAEARGIATDYERVTIATAQEFIGYGLADLKGGMVEKSDHVAEVLDKALDDAAVRLSTYLSGTAKSMLVPRFQTGLVELKDGQFWADTLVPSTGVKERRPVFFMGYCGFYQTIADIPKFESLGCNIIQSVREGGGGGTVIAEDTVSDHIVIGSVPSAAKNNVVVDWLSNTEYFPHWARNKWPELEGAGGAFYDIKVDAPQARRIFKLNLEACLKVIGDNPALHSVCLMNEPTSEKWAEDQFKISLWHDYLRRMHGAIDNVNALNGTNYKSFEDVPVRPTQTMPPDEEMTPLWYDQMRFNMDQFAGFHRFLTDVIHKARPGTLTHTKMMAMLERDALHYGTDPDQFSYIGDLNGNDTWNKFVGFGDRYATLWQRQNMFYDMQRSFRPVPIVNSENHVIAVSEPREIPPAHTDCALWQGCIHGMASSMVWVWEHFYREVKVENPPDFYCNDTFNAILTRPENVMAVGRVGLDLMRLAPEVYKMQTAKSPVAIMYGLAAQIWSERASDAMMRAYEAMAYNGLPVVFVSERQVREGHLSKFRAVILPSIRHVPDDVARAIEDYASKGGKVWIIGEKADALGRDQYGRSRQAKLPKRATLAWRETASPMELRASILKAFADLGIQRRILLKDPYGVEPWAIDYRSVRDGNGYLVSMANYWGAPKKVSIFVDGRRPLKTKDLREDRTIRGNVIEMKPLQAVLLKVE